MSNNIWHNPHWATSANGKFIELHASEQPAQLVQKQPVIFIGGVHGDEPEGVVLAEAWLAWLNDNIKVTTQPWLLIPCLNPDGYHKNQRTNGNGVDLNRNYPSKCWQAEYEQPQYYPGKTAGSEPEIAALVKLIEMMQPSLIVHFHSWEPSVVYSGEKAKWAAEHLAASSGYRAQPDIGYPTPGSLGEYGANDLDIGVICIEEQEGQDPATIFPRFKAGLIEIIKSNN